VWVLCDCGRLDLVIASTLKKRQACVSCYNRCGWGTKLRKAEQARGDALRAIAESQGASALMARYTGLTARRITMGADLGRIGDSARPSVEEVRRACARCWAPSDSRLSGL